MKPCMRGASSGALTCDRLDHGALNIARLGATLPGSSELSLNGTLDAPMGQRQFRGAVELESNDLRLLLDWLGANSAGIPADRLRKLSLSSRFAALPDRIEIAGIDLTVDATRPTGGDGRATSTFGCRRPPAIDQLNIDAYPPPRRPLRRSGAGQHLPPGSRGGCPGRPHRSPRGFDANIDAAVDT